MRAQMPPPGTYDPSLDAALRASQRGLADLTEDVSTANQRGLYDYGIAREDIARNASRSVADLELNRGELERGYGRNLEDVNLRQERGLADLGQSRTRGTEDYNRNVALLQRSFQQLGARQAQNAQAMGVVRGGAVLQAAARRAENQGIEQQGMNTNFNRFLQDNATTGTRLQQDTQRTLGRLGENRQAGLQRLDVAGARTAENRDLSLGRLALAGQRESSDRTTQLGRAQREQTAFGLDTNRQILAQAAQFGWRQRRPSWYR